MIDLRAALIAVLLMAGPAEADVLVGTDLTTASPRPEDLQVFDDRIRMAARIVFDGTETPAHAVDKVTMLRMQMGFITSADVAPGRVRLTCDVFFVSPDNQISRRKRGGVCFDGDLADVAGQWVPMKTDLRFRPEKADENGTWGVRIEVTDQISGKVAYFMPTYGWQGGVAP